MLYRPDEQPFADYVEVQQQLEAMEKRAVEAENRAIVAEEQLEQERKRTQRLEELLREAGIDPNEN